jgi:hypothetical protein
MQDKEQMTFSQMWEAEIQFRIDNACDFNITEEDFDELGEEGIRKKLRSIISGDELIELYGHPILK